MKMCGPQIWLCLFMFRPIASKHLNSLTTTATHSWPIDSPSSCPGLHDLRIACRNTYDNMKAISLHSNITDQLMDYVMVKAICIGIIDTSRHHFGGLSIGQLTRWCRGNASALGDRGPGSISGSGKCFYVWFFVMCWCEIMCDIIKLN